MSAPRNNGAEMKIKILLVFCLLAVCSEYLSAEWTKVDYYGHEEEVLEQGGGFADGNGIFLKYQGDSGYFITQAGNTRIIFNRTVDRGESWDYTGEIDSLGWIIRNGELFFNGYANSCKNCCITENSLFLLFSTFTSNNSNLRYKVDDTTVTENPVVLDYDRDTDKYQVIETNLHNKLFPVDFKMIDEETGYILTWRELYITEDGCKTWQLLDEIPDSSGTKMSFRSMSVPIEDNIYLCAYSKHYDSKSLFRFSEDGGESWQSKEVDFLTDIDFDASGRGFVIIYDNYLVTDTSSQLSGKTVPYRANICRTDDFFNTCDTLLSSIDSLAYSTFEQDLLRKDSVILAFWGSRQDRAMISFDSGKSFEFLNTVGVRKGVLLGSYCEIIDSNRLIFDDSNSSTWYIYDKETGSGIEYADIFEDTQMKIYPNIISNNESVTVELESSNGQEITFEILDYTGRCIERYTETCTRDNLKIKYEPERNLASGMYLMTARSGGKLMAAQKFIIRER